jgi:hypothetical protein
MLPFVTQLLYKEEKVCVTTLMFVIVDLIGIGIGRMDMGTKMALISLT